jgi:hypothetical protein
MSSPPAGSFYLLLIEQLPEYEDPRCIGVHNTFSWNVLVTSDNYSLLISILLTRHIY